MGRLHPGQYSMRLARAVGSGIRGLVMGYRQGRMDIARTLDGRATTGGGGCVGR